MMKAISFIGVILALNGCASNYHKKSPLFGTLGYVNEKIDENSYYLKYKANGFTSIDKTKDFWNRRAQELCGDLKVEAIHEEKMIRVIYPVFIAKGGFYNETEFPEVAGVVKCVNKVEGHE